MNSQENYLIELRKNVKKEIKIIKQIISFSTNLEKASSSQEREMILAQITSLKGALRKSYEDVSGILEDMSIIKPLSLQKIPVKGKSWAQKKIAPKPKPLEMYTQTSPDLKKVKSHGGSSEITELEKRIIKRLKNKEKKVVIKKEKKASKYVRTSNKFFRDYAEKLHKKSLFISLKKDLLKANLDFIPQSYISVIFYTTFLATIAGVFIFLFFLFFTINFGEMSIKMVDTGIGTRFLQVFWILLAAPLFAFAMMFFYPSMEKKYIENKINQELPFATIHMSAISGSMVEPSKIFDILIATKEYPFLEKEFTKLINEINVYGYDLITALRNVGTNSASSKLGEIFNGIATTINSGGDLQNFFDKRSQSLLFDYRLEREKYTKTAETFMDIYISLVIAAPMILMLLLMMMNVSGLGIGLAGSTITLIMVLGVSMINVIFLVFLQLKQPAG